MFSNNVEQLKQQGFKISKTHDLQTVVEHAEQFVVQGSAGEIKAPFNDETNTYRVTISGHATNGELTESFKRPYLPFLATLNEESNRLEAQALEQQATNTTNVVQKKFSELEEGDTFFKESSETATAYVKLDEVSYKRSDSSIASSLNQIAKLNDSVFVVEMDDSMEMLSPEQKRNIVDHVPEKGLDKEHFTSFVIDDIDNIAGLEMLNDDQLSDLIDELYQLYVN